MNVCMYVFELVLCELVLAGTVDQVLIGAGPKRRLNASLRDSVRACVCVSMHVHVCETPAPRISKRLCVCVFCTYA